MKRIVLTVSLLLLMLSLAHGQGCAVCSKVAAGMDDKSAKGLNGGILYLAFLPLAIIGTMGIIWYRYNRNN